MLFYWILIINLVSSINALSCGNSIDEIKYYIDPFYRNGGDFYISNGPAYPLKNEWAINFEDLSSYNSTVTIYFKMKRLGDIIAIFYSKSYEIQSVHLLLGPNIVDSVVCYFPESELLFVDSQSILKSFLLPESTISLVIKYKGKVADNKFGFQSTNDSNPTVFMKFNDKPNSMIHIVPSMDDVSFKYNHLITIKHSSQYQVLSDKALITTRNGDKSTTTIEVTTRTSLNQLAFQLIPTSSKKTIVDKITSHHSSSLTLDENRFSDQLIDMISKFLQDNHVILFLNCDQLEAIFYQKTIVVCVNGMGLSDKNKLDSLLNFILKELFLRLSNDRKIHNQGFQQIIDFLKMLFNAKYFPDSTFNFMILKKREQLFDSIQHCEPRRGVSLLPVDYEENHVYVQYFIHATLSAEEYFDIVKKLLEQNKFKNGDIKDFLKILQLRYDNILNDYILNLFEKEYLPVLKLQESKKSNRLELKTSRLCLNLRKVGTRVISLVKMKNQFQWIGDKTEIDSNEWRLKPQLGLLQRTSLNDLKQKNLDLVISMAKTDDFSSSTLLNDHWHLLRQIHNNKNLKSLFSLIKGCMDVDNLNTIMEILKILQYFLDLSDGIPEYERYFKQMMHNYITNKVLVILKNSNSGPLKVRLIRLIKLFYYNQYNDLTVKNAVLSTNRPIFEDKELPKDLNTNLNEDVFDLIDCQQYMDVESNIENLNDEEFEVEFNKKNAEHGRSFLTCTRRELLYKKLVEHVVKSKIEFPLKVQMFYELGWNPYNKKLYFTSIMENLHKMNQMYKDSTKEMQTLICKIVKRMEVLTEFRQMRQYFMTIGFSCIESSFKNQYINQKLRKYLKNCTECLKMLEKIN